MWYGYSFIVAKSITEPATAYMFLTRKFPSGRLAVRCCNVCVLHESERITLGRKWFDCADCHREQEDHPLLQKLDMVDRLRVHDILLC